MVRVDRQARGSGGPESGAVLDRIELESARLVRHFEMLRRRSDLYTELERAEYLLLRTLADAGPLDICGLAARLGVDPSTAGRQVGALAEEGLVRRTPAPEDRRRGIVELTEAGREVMERVRDRRRGATRELLADWSAQELAGLAEAFGRYNETITRHYGG